MCQHDQTREAQAAPVESENEHKQDRKPQKKWEKQKGPKQQQKAPTQPPRTLHEAMLSESRKIANGTRYVDVHSTFMTCLTVDTLSYLKYIDRLSTQIQIIRPSTRRCEEFLPRVFPRGMQLHC